MEASSRQSNAKKCGVDGVEGDEERLYSYKVSVCERATETERKKDVKHTDQQRETGEETGR